MNTHKRLMRKATKLVDELQADITSGRKQIYENYGQKQIRNFIDKEISCRYGELSYQEECKIKEILYKVADIA